MLVFGRSWPREKLSLYVKGNLKGKLKRNLLPFFVLVKGSFTDRDNFSLGQLLPNTSITAQNNKLKPKVYFLHTINTSCHFANGTLSLSASKVFSLAICASALLDELVNKSCGDEDSSLSEGNSSNSSSSDSALLSVSGSSGTTSEMSEVSSVDSTSIIDDLLGIVAQVHDQMEIGMEDNTIQLGKRLLIQDLSEDDALSHFCFCKVHLQEVADKLIQ